jgi:hypothetical protein
MSRPEGVVEDGTSRLVLPPEVEPVFREFRTCEFSTLACDGARLRGP